MKLLKYILVLVGAALISVSCFKNQYATSFTDKDAFIGFDMQQEEKVVLTATMTRTIKENIGIVHIPIRLSSISGLSGSVKVQIVKEQSTAKDGEQYTDPGVVTLEFDKEHPVRNFDIPIIYDDSVNAVAVTKLYIILTDATGVKLGAANHLTLKIEDNEHPLMAMEGTYTIIDYDDSDVPGIPYEVDITPIKGKLSVGITGMWGIDAANGGLPITVAVDAMRGVVTIAGNQKLYNNGPIKQYIGYLLWYDYSAPTVVDDKHSIIGTVDFTSGVTITLGSWRVVKTEVDQFGDLIEANTTKEAGIRRSELVKQ